MNKEKDIWPCTIIRDRYSGSYVDPTLNKGEWFAIAAFADELPKEFLDTQGDNVDAMNFWDAQAIGEGPVVGTGKTPQAAYENLIKKMTS